MVISFMLIFKYLFRVVVVNIIYVFDDVIIWDEVIKISIYVVYKISLVVVFKVMFYKYMLYVLYLDV